MVHLPLSLKYRSKNRPWAKGLRKAFDIKRGKLYYSRIYCRRDQFKTYFEKFILYEYIMSKVIRKIKVPPGVADPGGL